jgi:hypothetical protein
VTAETLMMFAMASIVIGVLVGRLLETGAAESAMPAPMPGNLVHPTQSDVDLLRVGSAALVTLRGQLGPTEARKLARRCGDMISDGVAHVVVEFKDTGQVSEPVIQLLLCLSELERVRHGRVCVVCPDHMALDRLESAGLFDQVSVLAQTPIEE